MKPSPYEYLWKDSRSWLKGVFYFCKEDPRCIVPKKNPWMGWTLNFAHKRSYLILVGSIALVLGVSAVIKLVQMKQN